MIKLAFFIFIGLMGYFVGDFVDDESGWVLFDLALIGGWLFTFIWKFESDKNLNGQISNLANVCGELEHENSKLRESLEAKVAD